MEQGREAFVAVGSLVWCTDACTRQAARASAAPDPPGGARRQLGEFRGPAFFGRRFSFFLPPSYTHRPWFTRPAPPARSRAVVQKPTNDSVCVLVEIDSRPPEPSPGSHMPGALGRDPRFRPTLQPTCPTKKPTCPYQKVDLPYRNVDLPYSRRALPRSRPAPTKKSTYPTEMSTYPTVLSTKRVISPFHQPVPKLLVRAFEAPLPESVLDFSGASPGRVSAPTGAVAVPS
jgi:hypothetical protein